MAKQRPAPKRAKSARHSPAADAAHTPAAPMARAVTTLRDRSARRRKGK